MCMFQLPVIFWWYGAANAEHKFSSFLLLGDIKAGAFPGDNGEHATLELVSSVLTHMYIFYFQLIKKRRMWL